MQPTHCSWILSEYIFFASRQCSTESMILCLSLFIRDHSIPLVVQWSNRKSFEKRVTSFWRARAWNNNWKSGLDVIAVFPHFGSFAFSPFWPFFFCAEALHHVALLRCAFKFAFLRSLHPFSLLQFSVSRLKDWLWDLFSCLPLAWCRFSLCFLLFFLHKSYEREIALKVSSLRRACNVDIKCTLPRRRSRCAKYNFLFNDETIERVTKITRLWTRNKTFAGRNIKI